MARSIQAIDANVRVSGTSTAADSILTSSRQQSPGFRLLRRLRGEHKAIAGLVIIALLALIAIVGPMVAPYHPDNDDFGRIVRGETLSLREQDFTMAARALGARDRAVMLRHIGPNLVAPFTVQLSFAVGLGILAESTLTYLGLGVNPTTPTWGLALNEGRDFVRQAWWISVFPGLAIVITVMALNLLGDGLRDALDVRGVSDV